MDVMAFFKVVGDEQKTSPERKTAMITHHAPAVSTVRNREGKPRMMAETATSRSNGVELALESAGKENGNKYGNGNGNGAVDRRDAEFERF
jgi:hypothetical protein